MSRSTDRPSSASGPNNELRDALADLAQEGTGQGDHPDLEQLIAFYENRLDEEQAESVDEHLASCLECNSTLLDLTVFANDVAGGPDTRDDLADALAWRTMRDQLIQSRKQASDDATLASDPAATGGAEVSDREVHRPRWPMALAAGLLLAAVGLGIFASLERQRSADLAEQVAVLTAPQHDVPILYLDAVTRGQSIDRPSIAVGENDRWVVIVAPPSEQAVWSAALYAEGSEPVWEADELRTNELGTLRLSFALPTGPYRLKLRAQGENHLYEFVVRAAPGERRLFD